MAAVSLTVCRGGPPTNQYVWSPFVTKLEARLRFDGVAYALGAGSPKTAPRGKIPYVQVEHAGTVESIGDSSTIIRTLISNGTLSDLNDALSAARRAHDLAVRALMEDKVYFYGTREKWCDNYTAMRSGALAAIPWPLQWLVGLLAYRGVASALYGQGTGRLSDEEVRLLKEEVWEGVDALLAESRQASGKAGNEPFWVLGGAAPTEADATLFGFVAGALVCTA